MQFPCKLKIRLRNSPKEIWKALSFMQLYNNAVKRTLEALLCLNVVSQDSGYESDSKPIVENNKGNALQTLVN